MSDESQRVWVFFYGTFMDVGVLAEYGVSARTAVAAKVGGFALTIRPRVNLVASDGSWVYGGLVEVTHEDLGQLYRGLEQQYGLTYLPEAVLAETLDGWVRSAMCYVAAHMAAGAADPGYIQQLAACVRALGLPEWYARHVESFGPAPDAAG